MIKKKISLVFPIYNEEKLIEKNIKKIHFFLSKNFKKFEIIVIESGSTDQSLYICKKIKKKYKNLKLIVEKKRNGFGAALKKGFKLSSGNIISLFTIDFTFDLKHYLKASRLLEKYDCVLSYRTNDDRSLFRKFQSIIFNFVAKKLLTIKVKSINSALKVYKSNFIKRLKIKSDGWLIDTEIVFNIQKKNLNIIEIPVKINYRKEGESSIKILTPIIIFFQLINFYLKNI